MNRRSFLSSLAALSLPAVVAGKVAEIAGYGTLPTVEEVDALPCGCPCCVPDAWTVEITGHGDERDCTYVVTREEYRDSMKVIEDAFGCEVGALTRPCTVTPIG